jgi:hypothetical protein
VCCGLSFLRPLLLLLGLRRTIARTKPRFKWDVKAEPSHPDSTDGSKMADSLVS